MDAESLERLVGTWPGVTSDVKWGDDLVYSVAAKMFAVFCLRGTYAGRVSFKVDDERFLEMTDRHGVLPAPYMARAHWVTVSREAELAPKELDALIRHSYQLVRGKLPKRVQRDLGAV